MATSDEIKRHVSETFAGAWAQVSYHGCNRGSVQVFTLGNDLIVDIDTMRFAPGYHDIDLAEIDRLIRAEFPRLVEG